MYKQVKSRASYARCTMCFLCQFYAQAFLLLPFLLYAGFNKIQQLQKIKCSYSTPTSWNIQEKKLMTQHAIFEFFRLQIHLVPKRQGYSQTQINTDEESYKSSERTNHFILLGNAKIVVVNLIRTTYQLSNSSVSNVLLNSWDNRKIGFVQVSCKI